MSVIHLRPAVTRFPAANQPDHSANALSPGQRRVAALQAMAVLDTPPEEGFDALTRLAAHVFDAPIALVSLIDGPRLWFKSAQGMDSRVTDSKHSFCREVADFGQVLQVVSARQDARFANHALVKGPLSIQYYAGAPIIYEEVAIGTVCVLDYKPRMAPIQSLYALEEMAHIATVMLRARIEAFALFSSVR